MILEYLTTTQVFVIMAIALLGWTFACAFGIHAAFAIRDSIRKNKRITWLDSIAPKNCHCGNATIFNSEIPSKDEFPMGIALYYCLGCFESSCDENRRNCGGYVDVF